MYKIYTNKFVVPEGYIRKILLIMRLTTIILLVTLLQVSAKTYSQSVTLDTKKASLTQILDMIRNQTGYDFIYSKQMLKDAKPVTIHAINKQLTDVLDECFADQPLTYQIKNKVVLLEEKKEPSFLEKVIDKIQSKEIYGRITDTLNNPLAGANVKIKDKNIATTTNADGSFRLNGVNDGDLLVVTYIGFQEMSIRIKANGGDYILRLLAATNRLDQVVIQAYGVTTQRLNTGDIGRVTAAEIEKNPVINPLLALQGKIPGLIVTQSSGYASGPVNVELRGKTSIVGFPSDPLYIIDGVPLTIIELNGNTNADGSYAGLTQNGFKGPAGGQSPFFNISPDNIESIEVLKDADATAIYGSRGANGVIIITTKKGKAGKTQFDFNVRQGVTGVTKYFNVLNTAQYLEMRKEAFKNDGIDYTTPANAGKAYDLLQWDQNSYTDWQRKLFGNTGKNTNVNMSISGGNQETTFRLGGGFNRTTSITTVSGADQVANVSLNISHSALNNRLHLTLISDYSNSQSGMITLPSKTTYAPNAPGIYDDQGNLNYNGWGGKNTGARRAFPFSSLEQPYSAKTSLLNSNFVLSYEIAKNISFSSSFGYNVTRNNQDQYTLIASLDPLSNPNGSATTGINNNQNLIVEPKITYSKVIGKGKFDILVGGSSQKTNTDGLVLFSDGYTSDLTIKSISNATSLYSQNVTGEYKYAGVFGRVNFNWDNKYLINISARRDGSSRFGAGKQFGNFGAIGMAWVFTEEKWLKYHLPFLSYGKLRASYGTTGSDAIGDYKYLTRWSANGIPPYGNGSAIIPTQHANPDYRWQENKKLEMAMSLGFFNDRILVEGDYYRDRIGNQLVNFPLPAYTGFTSAPENSPALVENSGWEFSANTKIIDNKVVNWSFNFNIGINKNKLVSYPLFELSPYVNTLVVGQPLNITRFLHATGVDPQTGQYTFEDRNNDGQITTLSNGQPGDTYIVNLSPKFTGGFGTNFSYKGLQLGVFFTYRKQTGKNGSFGNGVPGQLNINQPTSVLGRWQKPGDITSIARFTTQPARTDALFANYSDGVYTDASFIRLSNLSLAYALPDNYIKQLGLKKLSVYINANNLLVFTKYKGLDPETQVFGGLPPTRTIVAGVNFNF